MGKSHKFLANFCRITAGTQGNRDDDQFQSEFYGKIGDALKRCACMCVRSQFM